MKKKFLLLTFLFVGVIMFSACGKSKIDLSTYLIEERETLFTGTGSVYNVTYSGGMREENYSIDGEVGTLVPFGVITLTRTDGEPLANDTYNYTVTINDQTYTGVMESSSVNSYSADIAVNAPVDAKISVKIDFTGYRFEADLTNTSNLWTVDKKTALNVANNELQESVKNILSTKGTKIEVVTKILKDYSSSEVGAYYWYVGVVSTNGETLGLLLDANTSEIIAKKV